MELKIDQIVLSEEASNNIVDGVSEKIEPTLKLMMDNMKQKEWMSLGEACDYIGISRSTLTTHFIEKGLPVCKIQQVKRISKKDIDDFLNENKI